MEKSELHARLICPLTSTFGRWSRPRRILQLIDGAHVSSIETWLRVRVQEHFIDVDHTLQNIRLTTIEHSAAHHINGHICCACSLKQDDTSSWTRVPKDTRVPQKLDCLYCIARHLRNCPSRFGRDCPHRSVSRWHRTGYSQRARCQAPNDVPRSYRNAFFNALRPDEDSIMFCMVFVAAAIASLHRSSYVAKELRTTFKYSRE